MCIHISIYIYVILYIHHTHRDLADKAVVGARGDFAAVGRVRDALDGAVALEIHQARVPELRLVDELEPIVYI